MSTFTLLGQQVAIQVQVNQQFRSHQAQELQFLHWHSLPAGGLHAFGSGGNNGPSAISGTSPTPNAIRNRHNIATTIFIFQEPPRFNFYRAMGQPFGGCDPIRYHHETREPPSRPAIPIRRYKDTARILRLVLMSPISLRNKTLAN